MKRTVPRYAKEWAILTLVLGISMLWTYATQTHINAFVG